MTSLRRKNSIYDTRIAGLYDLAETIGRGHFAVVKAAKHVFTGERVAVKVIDKTKIDALSKEHLFQEVRCMKLVQHPNIVRLYEVIDTQTRLFLILELGDYDLFDYIMKKGELGVGEKEAQRYFFQIAHAIAYCHELHVVHRDLKPENVVFMEKLQMVKLTDFGFSNLFTPGQHLDTSCGSLAYSAPEILLGDSYDAPAVDVWSLGVILYMMVCGRLPFQETNDSETLTKILDCSYDLPDFLSEECKNVVRKMMVREPSKRATLSEVSSMPWVRAGDCGHAALLPMVSRHHVADDTHDQIVLQMVEGNIASADDICRALELDDYSYITATYYLLVERFLRKGRYEQAMQILEEQQKKLEDQLKLSQNEKLSDTRLTNQQPTSPSQQPISGELRRPTDFEPSGGDDLSATLPPTTTLTVSKTATMWRQRTCSIVREESAEDDDDDVMSVHFISSRSASPTRGLSPTVRRWSGGSTAAIRRMSPLSVELRDFAVRLTGQGSGAWSSASGSRSPSPIGGGSSGGRTSPRVAARYKSLPSLSRKLSRGSSPHLLGICEEGGEMTSSSTTLMASSTAAGAAPPPSSTMSSSSVPTTSASLMTSSARRAEMKAWGRSQTLAAMRLIRPRKVGVGAESSCGARRPSSSSAGGSMRRSASCSSSETSDDDERRLTLIRTKFCRRAGTDDSRRRDNDEDPPGGAGTSAAPSTAAPEAPATVTSGNGDDSATTADAPITPSMTSSSNQAANAATSASTLAPPTTQSTSTSSWAPTVRSMTSLRSAGPRCPPTSSRSMTSLSSSTTLTSTPPTSRHSMTSSSLTAEISTPPTTLTSLRAENLWRGRLAITTSSMVS